MMTRSRRIGHCDIVVMLSAVLACTRAVPRTESITSPMPSASAPLSLDTDRFAKLALACIEREYPNKVAHTMKADDDALPPHRLTPSFYGCFDWHSAVHGHWLLVRLLRTEPDAAWAADARAALRRNLAADRLAGELAYLSRDDREGFERPYGLAWLLQLGAELRAWKDADAQAWSRSLAPLETIAAERLARWAEKLSHPVRAGEHSQSAFALGLALDWARATGNDDIAKRIATRARAMHERDRGCDLSFEPSGQDFLSPCLGAADLLRRVLDERAFATWLTQALPAIPKDGRADWLAPAVPTDRSDGKLVHLDGLNLSRAWMLRGIATALPNADARKAALLAASDAHAKAGLTAIDEASYEGSHWLGTFAVYLLASK